MIIKYQELPSTQIIIPKNSTRSKRLYLLYHIDCIVIVVYYEAKKKFSPIGNKPFPLQNSSYNTALN